MTIIYERHGEKVRRHAMCCRCGGAVRLKAGKSAPKHLCVSCKLTGKKE